MKPRIAGVVAMLVTALCVSSAALAQAPFLEKSIDATEGRSIRGVAFKDDSQDIFGADSQAGRIFRWSGILGLPDRSTVTGGFSFPVTGSLGDLAWADQTQLMCVARDNVVDGFDPFGTRVEGFAPFNGPVSGVAVNGSTIYVSNGQGTEVRVFERRTQGVVDVRLDKVITGIGTRTIHGLAYDEARRRMWISDDNRKIIMAFDDLLDNPDGASVAPALSFNPGLPDLQDMDFSNQLGLFYLAEGIGGGMRVYNAQGQQVDTFFSGLGFSAGVAAFQNRVWISDLGSTVNVFRREGQGRFVRERTFEMEECGGEDPSMAYDPGRNSLWVWTWNNGGFCQLNPETGALIGGRFGRDVNRPGPYGHSLTFAAGKLVTGTETFSTDAFRVWTILDDVIMDRRFEFAIPTLNRTGLAFDTVRNSLWVIGFNNGQPGDLFEYNPANGQLRNQFTVPLPSPWGTGFSFGARKLYQGTETATPDQVRVIAFGCTRDDQCPNGQICAQNVCIDRPCTRNGDCLQTQYCQFSDQGEDACEGDGICANRPVNCPNTINPVCGCDNIDYDNACLANAAGAAVQANGQCPLCRTDDDCPQRGFDGEFCEPTDLVCVECYLDAHCTGGEVCDLDRNICVGRPCDDNGDCSQVQYCNFPDQGGVVCGGQGICEDIPDVCTGLDAQVCGCDGNTYDNACLAARSSVDVAEEGACPLCRTDNDCPRPGIEGDFCEPTDLVCVICYLDAHCGGGLRCDLGTRTCVDQPCDDNSDCGVDLFCLFAGEEDNQCGGAGLCAVRPQVCPGVSDPVCGCDNTTYNNDCLAQRAGVTVRGEGACPLCRTDDDCPQPGFEGDFCEPEDLVCVDCYLDAHCDDGEICDLDRNVCVGRPCDTNADCPDGRFCQFPDTTCGGGGLCTLRPIVCSNDFDPVCGCDNTTYANACRASAAGASLRGLGACPVCDNDDDCPQGDLPGDFCEPSDRICVDCYLDLHCGEGESCDLDANICRFRCTRDAQCGDDEICDDFICREGCRSTPDCDDNQVCDPDRLVCGPGLECRRDDECEGGDICDNFICREGCRSNTDCEGGLICDSNRLVCVQDLPCHRDSDCDEGDICDDFVCREGCRSTPDCDDNQVCDPDRLVCIPAPECTRDEECAEDEICDDLICRQGCRLDADCAEDQVCDPDRLVCIPDVRCTTDEECAEDEICDDFICRQGCRLDEDCEPIQRCDPERLVCVPRNRCDDDGDCPEGEVCDIEAGQCRPEPECDEDSDCPEGEICDPDSRLCSPEDPCTSDLDCEDGQRCTPEEQICEDICVDNSECLDGEVCDTDGLCKDISFTVQGNACLCTLPAGDTGHQRLPWSLAALALGLVAFIRRR